VIDRLAQRAESGELGVRLWMMIRESNDVIAENVARYTPLRRIGDGFLTVGGIKRTIDGALGSRGAWLLEPYADSPESTGLATATIEDVIETARLALEHNLQLCVHAIGDRANREVLNIYEKSLSGQPDDFDARWRIEHAQHLHPADIPRFGELGVIASMHGIHCTSDAPWVYARLGAERAESGAYMWRDLIDSGAVVSNGTDAPVEDVDPIASFYASVSRRLKDGTQFFPEQCMTRMEALRSYTINAAFAAKEEDVKGTLSPCKFADIVVLSQNILTVAEDDIPATKVEMAIVGGEVVYEREQ
jgi:predicted amidohydrolase YtcJ